MPPAVVAFVGLSLVALVVASATPTHSLTGGAERADVEVTARVTWHSIRQKWTIDVVETEAEASRWINIGAFFQNLLSLTSGSREVILTIEPAGGGTPLFRLDETTGRGGVFGTKSDVRAVFREVPEGAYLLRVRVMGEAGRVDDERTRDLRVEVV